MEERVPVPLEARSPGASDVPTSCSDSGSDEEEAVLVAHSYLFAKMGKVQQIFANSWKKRNVRKFEF